MDYRKQTLEELTRKGSAVSTKSGLAGFDGFVDKIISVVDQRSGQGASFTPISTIAEFGARISAAAGHSTNLELFPRLEKLGGNGPILANALVAAGLPTRYIGALGDPVIHPVFADFARRTEAVSLADPGVTLALEFQDGKIMLGTMASLDEITYPRLLQRVGEGLFLDWLSRADLIALVNWTMIPNLTSVLVALLDKALPSLPPKDGGRVFFFDLADPEKRSPGDLHTVLQTLGRFRGHGQVTLGLNLKEAQQVDRLLGFVPAAGPEGLKEMASRIRRTLDLTTVVIHPTDCAVCATRDDAWWVAGPYVAQPLITTGAGDHFNAGFGLGQILGLTPPACLTLAVTFSGHYVRTGHSPSLYEAHNFIRNWS